MPVDRAANVTTKINNLGALHTPSSQIGLLALVIDVVRKLLAWNRELEARLTALEAPPPNTGRPFNQFEDYLNRALAPRKDDR